MRHIAAASATLLTALLCLLLPLRVLGQPQEKSAISTEELHWTWTDGDGHVRSRADLAQILKQHEQWLERHQEPEVVHDVGLAHAKLRGADLIEAVLTHADLDMADLTGADLTGADLTDAALVGTNLNRADLSAAKLSSAVLEGADLSGALFEPKELTTPDLIAGAHGLELMTYWKDSGPLTRLRKEFQDAGFRDQERAITYALNRHDADPSRLRKACEAEYTRLLGRPVEVIRGVPYFGETMPWSSFMEGSFKWIAFDLTCQYGFRPGRALRVLLYVWLLCSLIYLLFIHRTGWREAKGLPHRPSGIYFVASHESEATLRARRGRIRPMVIGPTKWWKLPFRYLAREWRVLRAAMFFSLMSAFNIGFRDINFGRWLRQLTRREYDLKAKGWARTVSGFQSLLSVYLIALWVLTYFGRPFG